jgi:hypothetical protein
VLDIVIFIQDKNKRPADYDYVYLKNSEMRNKYQRAGRIPKDTTEVFVSEIENKSYTWKELEDIQFNIPTKNSEVTEENLTIAFTLLKRAQQIMGIFCRHKVPEEVKFILDQAQSLADREADTELRKQFNTFGNEGAQKVDICLFGESLAWQWEKSRVCNHLDFNFLEIEEMIKQVGYKNWNRRTYDMFFKTGRDKNIDID